MEANAVWTALAFASVLTAIVLLPRATNASSPCDRVLCYFTGKVPAVQWWIYDPARRVNRLFLTLSAEASVRWDSSRSRVEYRVGNELFQADWRLGARPRRVAVFPQLPTIEDWWFNPDSSRWQLFTMAPLPETTDRPPDEGCRAELWQASHSGIEWKIVLADTQDCQDWYYPVVEPGERWSPDVAALMSHLPTLTPAGLAYEPSPESQGAELVEDSSECEFPLYFVPSRSSTHRGVLFRYLAAAAPEAPGPISPVYWMDRKLGRRVLLCGPDQPCPDVIRGVEVTEECGLLLVRFGDRARLVNVATGGDVGRLPRAGVTAFWGPPLKN